MDPYHVGRPPKGGVMLDVGASHGEWDSATPADLRAHGPSWACVDMRLCGP